MYTAASYVDSGSFVGCKCCRKRLTLVSDCLEAQLLGKVRERAFGRSEMPVESCMVAFVLFG